MLLVTRYPWAAVPIAVSASIPLVEVENASGRKQRRPGRKVAVFLLTDGPRNTLRKARTKRDEPRFTGDYRTSLVLGQDLGVWAGGGGAGPAGAARGPAAGGPP